MARYSEKSLVDYTNQVVEMMAAGSTIEELIQHTYQTFQLPLIVADPGYRWITSAGNQKMTDPFWLEIVEHGEPTDHTIMTYYIEDGLMQAITGSRQAINIDWGVCKDYPQTSGPIYIDDNLEGFVSVLFMEEKLLDFSLRLNDLLCRFCTILMRSKNFRLKHAINPVKELLAQKFFDTANYPQINKLKEYVDTLQLIPQYCIVVLAEKNQEERILSHIKSRIVKDGTNVLYLMKEQRLYVLFHHVQIAEFEKSLGKIIQQYDLYCGISDFFSDLDQRRKYIQQAEMAFETAAILNWNRTCTYFSKSLSEIILLHPLANYSWESMIPMSLKKLFSYDHAHETELVKTLEVYLHQRNDINQTAKTLHIHRNTLIYRLNKIRDLTKTEIDDPEVAWIFQLVLRVSKIKRLTI